MKNVFLSGIITATIIAVAGVIFYACKKDNEFNTTRNGELMGSTGTWVCNVTNSIGSITVSEGGTVPCTRYFVNRTWNEASNVIQVFRIQRKFTDAMLQKILQVSNLRRNCYHLFLMLLLLLQ